MQLGTNNVVDLRTVLDRGITKLIDNNCLVEAQEIRELVDAGKLQRAFTRLSELAPHKKLMTRSMERMFADPRVSRIMEGLKSGNYRNPELRPDFVRPTEKLMRGA